MSTNKPKIEKYPDWFDQEPGPTQKGLFKDALVDYILNGELRHRQLKPSVQLCRNILPTLRVKNRRWAKVTLNNFNPGVYKAHQRFVDTVRNLLNSKGEREKLRKAAEDEIDNQTEHEVHSAMLQHLDLTPHKYANEEVNVDPAEKAPRNIMYPDSEEDQPVQMQRPGMQFPTGVGHKRQIIHMAEEIKDEEQPAKRCKICELQELFNDFGAKKKAAKEAEAMWRSAKDSLHCIKSPRSQAGEDL